MHSLDIKRILSTLYTHIPGMKLSGQAKSEMSSSHNMMLNFVAGCSHMRNISASLMAAGRTPNLTSFCNQDTLLPYIILHTLSLSDLTQEEKKKNSYTVGTLQPKDNSLPILCTMLVHIITPFASPSSIA